MKQILEARNLTKFFPLHRGLRLLRRDVANDGLPVVENINLSLSQGEIFGLLGLNGAGKTTLVRMLCGLLPPSRGQASVLGQDVLRQARQVRAAVGLCSGEDRSFYWRLTGRQNLEFFGELHGLSVRERQERIVALFDLFGLSKAADQLVSHFSTGMRQRLSLVRALLHRPRLLFLDEPTRGLDLQAAERLLRIIREDLATRDGITIFLTTHQMQEAQQICHRVGILHQRRLAVVGEPGALGRQFNLSDHYRIHCHGVTGVQLECLSREWPGINLECANGKSVLAFNTTEKLTIAEILGRLQAFEARIVTIEHEPPSLAEVVRQVIRE